MRRAIHSIVLLLFTLYVQSVPVSWSLYYVFADRVAAVYCENPTTPSCHGRCHMAKVTAKQQRQDSPATVEITVDKPLPFVQVAPSSASLLASGTILHPPFDVPTIAGVASEIDHPPPFRS